MQKYLFGVLLALAGTFSIAAARTAKKPTTYTINDHNNHWTLQQISPTTGYLEDGTWVKIVCIKPGMIGMPNIALPTYRGKYINNDGETCYIYVREAEGTFTFQGKTYAVYRDRDKRQGFLNDGSKVIIRCFPPSSMVEVSKDQSYRGSYTAPDNRQCHVYAREKKRMVTAEKNT